MSGTVGPTMAVRRLKLAGKQRWTKTSSKHRYPKLKKFCKLSCNSLSKSEGVVVWVWGGVTGMA